jgi:hypothetical protein
MGDMGEVITRRRLEPLREVPAPAEEPLPELEPAAEPAAAPA